MSLGSRAQINLTGILLSENNPNLVCNHTFPIEVLEFRLVLDRNNGAKYIGKVILRPEFGLDDQEESK